MRTPEKDFGLNSKQLAFLLDKYGSLKGEYIFTSLNMQFFQLFDNYYLKTTDDYEQNAHFTSFNSIEEFKELIQDGGTYNN